MLFTFIFAAYLSFCYAVGFVVVTGAVAVAGAIAVDPKKRAMVRDAVAISRQMMPLVTMLAESKAKGKDPLVEKNPSDAGYRRATVMRAPGPSEVSVLSSEAVTAEKKGK